MIKCQNCGEEIEDGAVFCWNCGSKVVHMQKMFCHGCGAPIKPGVRYCACCGTDVDGLDGPMEDNYVVTNEIMDGRKASESSSNEEVISIADKFNVNTLHSVNNKKEDKNKEGKKNPLLKVLAVILLIYIVAFIVSLGKTPTKESPKAEEHKEQVVYTIKNGTTYSYKCDEKYVYIARAISDSLIKIERWKDKFWSICDMEYDIDLGTYKINDSTNGFAWYDDNQLLFKFTLSDKANSSVGTSKAVFFSICTNDENENKGTLYSSDIACYIYRNDSDHTYRAIPLSKDLFKVECWERPSLLNSFCYSWDLGIASREYLTWVDDEHSAFTITGADSKNPEWIDKKLVTFEIETDNYKYANVKNKLDSIANAKTEKAPQEGQTGTTKEQAHDFNGETNRVFNTNGFVIHIPSNWMEGNTEGYYYAERGGKSAFFGIVTGNYAVSDEKEMGVLIQSFLDGVEDSTESFEYSDTKFSIHEGTGLPFGMVEFKATQKGFNSKGYVVALADYDRKVQLILYYQESENTEKSYVEDYFRIANDVRIEDEDADNTSEIPDVTDQAYEPDGDAEDIKEQIEEAILDETEVVSEGNTENEENHTVNNDSDLLELMEMEYPSENVLSDFYNYTYTGYKIEFDGCVGYMEGSNNGVLLYYGDYSEMGPESGPMMTTWDVNTGRVRHADGVDISEYKIGDEVTAVVTLLPYKNGSGMYSVELQEIKHR